MKKALENYVSLPYFEKNVDLGGYVAAKKTS